MIWEEFLLQKAGNVGEAHLDNSKNEKWNENTMHCNFDKPII